MLSYLTLSRFKINKSYTMILNTLEYKIQQYTDFTNEKQKIFPPSSFVSNSLPHFISKEPTGMAG